MRSQVRVLYGPLFVTPCQHRGFLQEAVIERISPGAEKSGFLWDNVSSAYTRLDSVRKELRQVMTGRYASDIKEL